MFGVAEGTVKSRCARGRARLAVLLGHLRTGTDAPAGDVPRLTSGNRRPPEGVGSSSGASRQAVSQEEP